MTTTPSVPRTKRPPVDPDLGGRLSWGFGALVALLLPALWIGLAHLELALGPTPRWPGEGLPPELVTALGLASLGALVLIYAYWPVYALVVATVAGALGLSLALRRQHPRIAAGAAQTASTIGWVTVLGYFALWLLTLVSVALLG